jgi:hypothetical protein
MKDLSAQERRSGQRPVPQCATANPDGEGDGGSPITDRHLPITAFLINTLAIRIAPKPIDCIANVHSNQHSSGAQDSHCRTSKSRGRRKGTGLCAI